LEGDGYHECPGLTWITFGKKFCESLDSVECLAKSNADYDSENNWNEE